MFGNINRITRDLKTARVKRLRHECALIDIEQITGRRIDDARNCSEKNLSFLRIERAEANMMVLSCLRVAKKNKVASVWQKVGPAMCFFFGVDLCCEHRSSALRRNALQPFWSSKQDHAFATPGGATLFAHVAQLLR